MSLSLEFQEGIGLLKHDDGKRNVFSPDAIRDFNEALDEVEAKSASLLWVGREGCFSAGFDLKVVTGGDADAAAAMVKAGGELAFRIFTFPHPVVCAVTGHCLALGSVMLVCADKRIGMAGDFKYGLNETAIDMDLPAFGYEPAVYRLSEAHRFESIVAAQIHSPESALAAGFLDEVAAPEALIDRAMAHASRLGALPQRAFAANKLLSRSIPIERIRAAMS
ncbi:MAG: crotonase/enoyl-CoA hydratase family protein [Proteobacteria bacterium]|jgi:enoyl-CoA hydratase|nr:crotonase/enoyl-CoA hydratase family protein [Pseudomonadota bacterium]